ncbi:MAG: 50S ribosomal protein L23 [Armatimonadetes bacterium]|nr:50S ribosomal protein L23 [Armatimonadota bacterium]
MTKVNTLNVKPKKRGERWRRIRPVGHTPRWKKAIVTVAKGQTLPIYEGLL